MVRNLILLPIKVETVMVVIATIVTVIVASYFGATGGYKTIWPVFGAANQLVAALTLIVISAYLVGIKKPRVYTVIPAMFMTVTTIGALEVTSRVWPSSISCCSARRLSISSS